MTLIAFLSAMVSVVLPVIYFVSVLLGILASPFESICVKCKHKIELTPRPDPRRMQLLVVVP